MEKKLLRNKYYIAVFQSRNHALWLHQYLSRHKYTQYELISTPCKIKVGCSYSIKFNEFVYYDFLKDLCEKSSMPIYAIYEVVRESGKRTLNKLDM